MQSNKVMEKIGKIVKEHHELFDSLLEFEKTKKIRSKIRLNFTIDKSVASKFKKHCRGHRYNMSAKVQQAMENMIKNN